MELIEKRVVGPLRGFISAKPKKEFPALLKLDEEWKVKILFDNRPVGADGQKLDTSTMEPLAKCPVCEGSVDVSALQLPAASVTRVHFTIEETKE